MKKIEVISDLIKSNKKQIEECQQRLAELKEWNISLEKELTKATVCEDWLESIREAEGEACMLEARQQLEEKGLL